MKKDANARMLGLSKFAEDIIAESYDFQAKNPDLGNPYKMEVDKLQSALSIISDRIKDIAKED